MIDMCLMNLGELCALVKLGDLYTRWNFGQYVKVWKYTCYDIMLVCLMLNNNDESVRIIWFGIVDHLKLIMSLFSIDYALIDLNDV